MIIQILHVRGTPLLHFAQKRVICLLRLRMSVLESCSVITEWRGDGQKNRRWFMSEQNLLACLENEWLSFRRLEDSLGRVEGLILASRIPQRTMYGL